MTPWEELIFSLLDTTGLFCFYQLYQHVNVDIVR